MTFVNSKKLAKLESTLERLNINKSDVVEKFTRSSGRGGQNVNKVETAVYLKHIPTGIEVKAQKERSQALNRFLAWRLLAEKIENRLLGAKSEKQKGIEKIRRQKRRRSRKSKEKMLKDKRIVSEKKKSRKSISYFTEQ